MSSSVSPVATPTPEEREALSVAVAEVMECSFFALAERVEWEQFQQMRAAAEGGEGWWLTTVAFSGSFQGATDVAVPETLAQQLLEAFAGLMPGDPVSDEEVGQMMAELANMVTGAWLTRAHRQDKFDLSAPMARKVVAFDRPESEAMAWFAVNDAPVALWFDRSAKAVV